MFEGDLKAEDVGGTLAEGGPVVPAEFGLGLGREDGEHGAAEFALGDGAANGTVREDGGLAVAGEELILLLLVEVGKLDVEGVLQFPVAAGAFEAADGFEADEIGERLRVIEGDAGGGTEDAAPFGGRGGGRVL